VTTKWWNELWQLESISPKQRTCKINVALAQLYQRTGGNDRSAVTAYKEVLRYFSLVVEGPCAALRHCRIMPGFHHSVAVSPFPLRKFTKNYVSAVRITLFTWKIPLRHCRCHLPLHRNCHSVANRMESYFCRSAVSGQPISIPVTSSLCKVCIRKDVSSISVVTRNGNGSYGTEERQRYNGTEQRNGNGMVETRHQPTKWLAVKTASKMTSTVSGGALNSTQSNYWSLKWLC